MRIQTETRQSDIRSSSPVTRAPPPCARRASIHVLTPLAQRDWLRRATSARPPA